MNYPLLGAARGGGYRKRLGTLNDDEARELLKKREIEPMRDQRTGRTRFFVLAKRQSAMGGRARLRPECEHVVDEERHLDGLTYSPAHNIFSEIAFLRRAGDGEPPVSTQNDVDRLAGRRFHGGDRFGSA